MTDFTPDEPIVVHGSPQQAQIEAGIRQFFVAAGPVIGVLAATGWGAKIGLNNYVTLVLQYAGPIAGAIAFLWGQWETRKNAQKAATMANLLPNNQAVTK